MEIQHFANFGAEPTVTLGLQGDLATNTHVVFAPRSIPKSACAPCKNVPKSKNAIKKHVIVVSATADLWKNTMVLTLARKCDRKPSEVCLEESHGLGGKFEDKH